MIESNFPIFKVSDRVFMIGDLQIEKSFLFKLCEILDLGNKFVPSIFNKHSNFIRFFLNNLDCNLYNFNKLLFYSKQKYLSEKENNKTHSNCSTSHTKSFIYYLNKLNNKNNSRIAWQHETLVLRQLMIKTLASKPFILFKL